MTLPLRRCFPASGLSLLTICLLLLAGCTDQSTQEDVHPDTTALDTTELERDTTDMQADTTGLAFSRLDTDRNTELSQDEFASGLGSTGFYDGWPTDKNTDVGEEEFSRGLFENWDTNQDGALTEDEFNSRAEVWIPDYNYSLDEWDLDGNGELSENEFSEGLLDLGIFEDWDADGDGTLTENEFNESVYTTWDADGDGTLTQEEFNTGRETIQMNRESSP